MTDAVGDADGDVDAAGVTGRPALVRFGTTSAAATTAIGDRTVLEHIDALVAEEKALRARHAGRRLGDDDRARLSHLEAQLDQAWDLLRQRRAREEQHAGLSDVHGRPEREVEGYLQ